MDHTHILVHVIYYTDVGLEYMPFSSFPTKINITDTRIQLTFDGDYISLPKDKFISIEVFR